MPSRLAAATVGARSASSQCSVRTRRSARGDHRAAQSPTATTRSSVLRVPAGFLSGNAVIKGLSGVLTLLRDGGYDDEAAIRWLHTPDDSLPGTPVEALAADRGREVKRRAQALAL